jgi:hypothetical protein
MKTLKQLIEGYEESSPQDIQDIIKKLKIDTYVDDSLKDDEEAFSPDKVKEINRKKERHGYSTPEDEKASDEFIGKETERENKRMRGEVAESESDSAYIDRIAKKIAKDVDFGEKKKEVKEQDELIDMYIDVLTSMIVESSDEEREELMEALDDESLFNDVMDAIDQAIQEELSNEE